MLVRSIVFTLDFILSSRCPSLEQFGVDFLAAEVAGSLIMLGLMYDMYPMLPLARSAPGHAATEWGWCHLAGCHAPQH